MAILDPVISVRGLTKKFGDKSVLHQVDLEVAKGEIVAIMGSSGGGKTTLLRCISGLLSATSGSISVDGIDIQADPESARRKMGMVFQQSALFDYLTVADNILFGSRRWFKLTMPEQQALLAETLSQVGLQGTGNLYPAELSGGMKKRAGMARALALKPEIMLYDEPTTGLDPITTYTIDALIVDVRRSLGVTSLIVSHDLSSVFRVADRVAFLNSGALTFVGTPEEFASSKDAAIRELVSKSESRTLNITA